VGNVERKWCVMERSHKGETGVLKLKAAKTTENLVSEKKSGIAYMRERSKAPTQ